MAGVLTASFNMTVLIFTWTRVNPTGLNDLEHSEYEVPHMHSLWETNDADSIPQMAVRGAKEGVRPPA